jgi:uncharacterized phage-associated protein
MSGTAKSNHQDNHQKFYDLLLYLIAQTPEGEMGSTRLMKLLYFVESEYYLTHGQTLSGETYYCNHHGPTVDVKVLEDDALNDLKTFLTKDERDNGGDSKSKIYKLISKQFTYPNLTEEEVECIDTVFQKYKHLSARELRELSHADPPFLAADKHAPIDFSYVRFRQDEEDLEGDFTPEQQEEFKSQIPDEAVKRLFDHVRKIS